MKILVINCGSSSLKYQLFDMADESVMAKGLCERIGIEGSKLTHKPTGKESCVIEKPMPDHKVAVNLVLEMLLDKNYGVISDVKEISAVGHRVLHAGQKYCTSVIVNDDVKSVIRECFDLGPLHNPANLIGIEAVEAAMPGTPNVAVWDTAFHQTMPEKAYMYAIPHEYYEKYGIRKYGFHGTSHRFVTAKLAEIMGKDLKDLKVVSCHLGNGSSITAVQDGKSVDTTMGFTPLDGVLMGTRCGAVDPSAVTYVAGKHGFGVSEMDTYMNKKSGMLGISGESSDFRDITAAAEAGDKRATLAKDMLVYDIKKDIGAYAAAMNGLDAVIFTGGIGENAPNCREEVCENMEYLGIKIDKAANDFKGELKKISTPDSKVEVWVIPTNEELLIARDTLAMIQK